MTPFLQLLILSALSLSTFASEVRAGSVASPAHVDLSPITIERLRTRTDKNSTIDGPATFAKVRRSNCHKRATNGNPKGSSYYSAVVAVGAS